MGEVATQIQRLKSELNEHVTLVAISKTKPEEMILDGYSTGHLDYGENKVQELVSKYESLPKDIRWHMVGHLQRNKVKYIAPFVHLIHSVDSLRLLKAINKEAKKNDRVVNCLLQVHIAEESSKFGFDETELLNLLQGIDLEELQNIKIVGLMGMATFTEDVKQIRKEFTSLKSLFDRLSGEFSFSNFELGILSMGMSGDYQVAIECGSNMVRIGSSIFGERNYG